MTTARFSGLYFPSQYWYEGVSFVWDAGGDIATQAADGTWTGTLDSDRRPRPVCRD